MPTPSMSPLIVGLRTRLIDGEAQYSIADQIAVSAFNFAVAIAAARLLGVADFGLFALIMMVILVAGAIQSHLLSVPMMVLVGARPRRSTEYFDSIFVLGLGFSIGAGLLTGLLCAFYLSLRGGPFSLDLALACALAAQTQLQLRLLRRNLFARKAYRLALTVNVGRMLAMGGFVALAPIAGIGIDLTALLTMLGLSALVVTAPFSFRSLARGTRARMLRAIASRHWPTARWMVLMLLVSLGQEQAIWVFIGVQLGEEAVGGLRAGQYLLGATHIIVLALENFVPRNAAEQLRLRGRPGLRSYLIRQTWVFGAVIGVMVFAVAALAETGLSLVFGAQFADFAAITRFFALVYLISFVRAMWTFYLRAVERTQVIFTASVAGSLCAIATAYPAIAWWGIEGAVVTMILAQAASLATILVVVAADRQPLGDGARPAMAESAARV